MIKERPILFSDPMVGAILEGRKTQTRRVIKPQPPEGAVFITGLLDLRDKRTAALWGYEGGCHGKYANAPKIPAVKCPYGQQGDRLWVRETWGKYLDDGWPLYRADYDDERAAIFGKDLIKGWRPSIHMPRAASRILLEITGVRVERLQDITGADALEEGFNNACGCPSCEKDALPWFKDLWEKINGHDAWDANPWVWVIEFKRIA